MNLSNSNEGSYSCQCRLTSFWENKGTERIVLRILSTSENMPENSRKDVGHFWGLDAKRYPILTNRAEKGTGLLKA